MASVKSFKKIPVQDKNLNKVQDNIQTFMEPIISCPLIDGTLVTNVCLEPGISNEVVHGLARKPIGYIIVRKRKDSRIWDLQDTNSDPSRTFSIACSHACMVDIWFF